MSEKREVVDLDSVSDDAKGILGAWFSLFGKASTLNLHMRENVPHPRTEAALAELVEKRIISVEPLNGYGGLKYRALKDCHPALAWLHANADRPEMKFPLMVPAKGEVPE